VSAVADCGSREPFDVSKVGELVGVVGEQDAACTRVSVAWLAERLKQHVLGC